MSRTRHPEGVPSAILGPDLGPLLDAAREDSSAWGPLSDALEEAGQPDLAGLARDPGIFPRAFLMKAVYFLAASGFDHATMEAVVQRPPFSVDRRWIVWKSLEFKPGWYNRVAVVMKGGRR
jgi:hypothetical protein